MTIRITRRKDILKNQKTSIEITINTTFRLESFINYENRRLGLHNRDDIVLEK